MKESEIAESGIEFGGRVAGDVVVRVALNRRTMRGGDFARIEVGEDGRYRAELPAGSYRVMAAAAGTWAPPPWPTAWCRHTTSPSI